MKIDRICFECDHRYHGSLYCPACSKPAGEPIKQEEQNAG